MRFLNSLEFEAGKMNGKYWMSADEALMAAFLNDSCISQKAKYWVSIN